MKNCFLETETSELVDTGSSDPVTFSFINNGVKISEVEIAATNKWERPSQSAFLPLNPTVVYYYSDFDEVRVVQKGSDDIDFKIFNINCGDRTADFVKSGGCSNLWFDSYKEDRDASCHKETASKQKTALLKEGTEF